MVLRNSMTLLMFVVFFLESSNTIPAGNSDIQKPNWTPILKDKEAEFIQITSLNLPLHFCSSGFLPNYPGEPSVLVIFKKLFKPSYQVLPFVIYFFF